MKGIAEAFKALKHVRVILLFICDALVLLLSSLISYIFVTSHLTSAPMSGAMVFSFLLPIPLCLAFMALFKVYRIVLKFVYAKELIGLICAVTASTIVSLALDVFLSLPIPRSFYFVFFLVGITGVCTERVLCNLVINKLRGPTYGVGAKPVLIIGAGYTGRHILNEMRRGDSLDYIPVGFVDDAPELQDHSVEDLPILGPTLLIPEFCRQHGIKALIFAIPSCEEKKRQKILSICSGTDCEVKVVPSLWELTSKAKFLPQTKSIKVEDVLGRSVVDMGESDFIPYASGKTVMVTGVGSIGSEICRQVVKCNIKKLIMVDIYENNAYDIQQELISEGYSDKIVTEIASVRDFGKMQQLFSCYRPDIVFHAAAHKHVPLMEQNPEEAVKNNILGTYNVARLSEEFGIDKMVLISTDKAVNPTNVMGASKRCCEMIMQYMAQRSKDTDFVAVRFGNVLGSNGSVIPLFVKQIEHGGPVTVTHPDIIRYFMTIPEAVSLVLEAGAMAKGGEIFVLDMGEPYKITTLAENLIKLYGYRPYEDIEIKFIGLRPGEKLFEELLMDEEGLKSTDNSSIFIGNQISIDSKVFEEQLERIVATAKENDRSKVIEVLKTMIPTFTHR